MDVIYWLIPLSLAILVVAVAVFFWAVRSGQFQDLDSAAMEILFDDNILQEQQTKLSKKTNKENDDSPQ